MELLSTAGVRNVVETGEGAQGTADSEEGRRIHRRKDRMRDMG